MTNLNIEEKEKKMLEDNNFKGDFDYFKEKLENNGEDEQKEFEIMEIKNNLQLDALAAL